MFDLSNQSAKLASVNVRSEIHGDEQIPACDLRFEIKVANDFLSEFHPSLKSSLYAKGEADLIEDQPGYLPKLKFDDLGALKWKQSFTGYELAVHYGISGKSDIVLPHCEVSKITFDCQDGGTVVCGFRVQCHPDEGQLGRLGFMAQQQVDITLTPPEA